MTQPSKSRLLQVTAAGSAVVVAAACVVATAVVAAAAVAAVAAGAVDAAGAAPHAAVIAQPAAPQCNTEPRHHRSTHGPENLDCVSTSFFEARTDDDGDDAARGWGDAASTTATSRKASDATSHNNSSKLILTSVPNYRKPASYIHKSRTGSRPRESRRRRRSSKRVIGAEQLKANS